MEWDLQLPVGLGCGIHEQRSRHHKWCKCKSWCNDNLCRNTWSSFATFGTEDPLKLTHQGKNCKCHNCRNMFRCNLCRQQQVQWWYTHWLSVGEDDGPPDFLRSFQGEDRRRYRRLAPRQSSCHRTGRPPWPTKREPRDSSFERACLTVNRIRRHGVVVLCWCFYEATTYCTRHKEASARM